MKKQIKKFINQTTIDRTAIKIIKYNQSNSENLTKKQEAMTQDEIIKLEENAEMLSDRKVKVVKKDRGLIERTESSKIILTEDNRQVLTD